VYKIIILIVIIGFSFFGLIDVHAQQIKLAKFQETALVFFDQQISQNVIASITLQSTSNQEIRVPSELEQKIRENDRILSVILTNEKQCILGVQDDACILVNISRVESEKGIVAIQDAAKEIGNSVIDDVNAVLDTNAKFHSVYVHLGSETNPLLETSGAVSGKGTVSAVYTMPREDTNSMYEKISSILVYSKIRESGGFFDVAKKLSSEETAVMTFSILLKENPSQFVEEYNIPYKHLSDSNKETCKKYPGLNIAGLAKRSTFVVDKHGIIRKIFRDIDVESHGKEISEFLKNMT